MNFISASDLFEQTSQELESVTKIEDAINIINKHKDFISFNTKDSVIELANIPNILSKIVNKDGIVKIGKDFYKFTKEKQYILLGGASPAPLLTKNIENLSGNNKNIVSFNYHRNKINARIPSGYSNDIAYAETSTSTRKTRFRLEYLSVISPVYDQTTALLLYWEVGSSAVLHAWGLKKVLFGWSFYKTTFTFTQLDYTAYSYPSGTSNVQNYAPFTTSETKNYYHYILRPTTHVSPIDFNNGNYLQPQVNLDLDMEAHSRGVPNPSATLSYH